MSILWNDSTETHDVLYNTDDVDRQMVVHEKRTMINKFLFGLFKTRRTLNISHNIEDKEDAKPSIGFKK